MTNCVWVETGLNMDWDLKTSDKMILWVTICLTGLEIEENNFCERKGHNEFVLSRMNLKQLQNIYLQIAKSQMEIGFRGKRK